MVKTQYRLEPRVWRYIEGELYNYDANKRSLAELREEIIEGAQLREAVGGSHPGHISDITASKAVRLVAGRAIAKMANDMLAIERALRRLTADHRAIYELYYQARMPWEQVTIEMPTSRRSFFRLRRELVLMVASEMGFDVDLDWH